MRSVWAATRSNVGEDEVDLDALLAAPARVKDVPEEAVPALLDALAVPEGRCRLLRDLLTARLAAGSRNGQDHPAPSEQGPLTQEEAARTYRMPLRSLRFLTRTGRVPSYQQGRNRMVRPADLESYLARCRAQGVKVGTILDG